MAQMESREFARFHVSIIPELVPSDEFDVVSRAFGYVRDRTCRNLKAEDETGDFHCSFCDARQDYSEVWGCNIEDVMSVQTVSHCPACGARVVE